MLVYQRSEDSLTRFTIMGERCSGTNYIEHLFLTNFNIEITWDYGWKHWVGFNDFKNDELENETLFICIIREPIGWIDSFYRHKYHIPKENHDIDNFLFNEWHSIEPDGNEINYINSIYRDVNYITGERFKNIFELRKLKNDYLKNIMPKKVKNYLFINYDNFILDPATNLNLIKEYYQLNYKNTELQLFTDYNKYPLELDQHYIDIIKQNVDLEQEKSLGFTI